jgi:hypothetical protein
MDRPLDLDSIQFFGLSEITAKRSCGVICIFQWPEQRFRSLQRLVLSHPREKTSQQRDPKKCLSQGTETPFSDMPHRSILFGSIILSYLIGAIPFV